MLTHIKDGQGAFTVVLNNQSYQFDAGHCEYSGLVDAVRDGDSESFLNLIEMGTVVEEWSEGSFEMRDGFLYFEDEVVANQPTERILNMIKSGWDHKPMLAYLERLYNNVSNRAVQESYTWCSHKGLPITEDGMLVGYKGVAVYDGEDTVDKMGNTLQSGDYVDKYTGKTFRNNLMDNPSMNRRKVSDDCTQGCAAGLHVGTYDYADSWAGNGGVVVLVKFDPANIVSVPTDCDQQKMRVTEYTVIGVAREQLDEEVFTMEDVDFVDSVEDLYLSDLDFDS